MLTTNDKGAQTEGAVLAMLLRLGYNVLIPFGVCRYDLVIETPGGEFKRVQCKTARVDTANDVMKFNVCSSPPGGVRRPYVGEIDYFGVYLPERDRVYLIPIDVVATCVRNVNFRLGPAKNGQKARTRLAEDYRLVAQQDRAPVS